MECILQKLLHSIRVNKLCIPFNYVQLSMNTTVLANFSLQRKCKTSYLIIDTKWAACVGKLVCVIIKVQLILRLTCKSLPFVSCKSFTSLAVHAEGSKISHIEFLEQKAISLFCDNSLKWGYTYFTMVDLSSLHGILKYLITITASSTVLGHILYFFLQFTPHTIIIAAVIITATVMPTYVILK